MLVVDSIFTHSEAGSGGRVHSNSMASVPPSSGEPLGVPVSKRQKIDIACNLCRTRKSKCDGARPSMSTPLDRPVRVLLTDGLPVCGPCRKRIRGREQCVYRQNKLDSVDRYVVNHIASRELLALRMWAQDELRFPQGHHTWNIAS